MQKVNSLNEEKKQKQVKRKIILKFLQPGDCSTQCQSNEYEMCISENSTYVICTCQNGYTYVTDKFTCSGKIYNVFFKFFF